MKHSIWLASIFMLLVGLGCKPSDSQQFDGPTRNLVVLNNSDGELRAVVERVADSTDILERRISSGGYGMLQVPLQVCHVFAFNSDDKVQGMIFAYDFATLDSNTILCLDGTEKTPYAEANAGYLYNKTDYLVNPYKYDNTRMPTAEALAITWHEAGKPFVVKEGVNFKAKEFEKEVPRVDDLRFLIPMPAATMSEADQIAFIDKYFKDLGTAY